MLSGTNFVNTIDPLTDPRWPEFLARHPEATIFHTREWLQALQITYGYEPVVFTTSGKGELFNGVVFCHIRSWLTGSRLVSLPFSDHCQPLADGNDLKAILQFLRERRSTFKSSYVEVRPLANREIFADEPGFGISETFSFHTIDLRPESQVIYRSFHDSCVRRKIKRAERESLTLESGNSQEFWISFVTSYFLLGEDTSCHLSLQTGLTILPVVLGTNLQFMCYQKTVYQPRALSPSRITSH